MSLSHLEGRSIDLAALSSSAGFQVNVLLGQPVFSERPVKIDYVRHLVFFLDPQQQIVCKNPLPLTFAGGVPIVEVSLRANKSSEPRKLHLIIDLGTRHYAAMIGGLYLDTQEGKELERTGKQMKVGTGTGGDVQGTSVSIENLTLGTQTWNSLPVALTRNVGAFQLGFADGSIGVPLWEHSVVTFDYPHYQFCIEQ